MRTTTLLLTTCLLLASMRLMATDDAFIRIPFGSVALLEQGATEGCGPTSLLNQLRLGPPAWRAAAALLAAPDQRTCLDRFVARYCHPDGHDGAIRYSHARGINDAELTRLWQRVANDHALTAPQTLYTTRRTDETDADFIARLNLAICTSLTRQVPLLMSIDSYGQRDGAWRKLTGHYLLITGAQRLGAHHRSSFLIEYLDPVAARHGQMFAHLLRREHAGAFAHLPDGDRWFAGSPYLGLCSPDTPLRQQSVPADARHECFLTLLIGDFAG